MKKNRHSLLLVALAAFTIFFATGCDPEQNAIGSFLFEESGGQYIVTDQFGNAMAFEGYEAEQLEGLSEAAASVLLTETFRAAHPQDYSNPETITAISGTDTVEPEVVPSDKAKSLASGLSIIPGYGEIASLAANGLLGLGALWLSKRKRTSEKVSESLVKGIDVFRDVLDQTPQGERIDEALKSALKERQMELRTAEEVNRLLQRYATPTKRAIPLDAVK